MRSASPSRSRSCGVWQWLVFGTVALILILVATLTPLGAAVRGPALRASSGDRLGLTATPVEDAILVGTREWGIVLDAGSSGTRALLYSWDSASPLDSVRQLWIKKQRPGLSSCAKPTIGVTMRECAERKILGLLETVGHSKEWAVVAASAERRAAQAQTHVILRATAGLRLLTKFQQDELLKGAASAINLAPFANCDERGACAALAPGAEEAKFDWFTVNVAFRTCAASQLQAPGWSGETSTLGVIDLGGASTQIAFALTPASVAAVVRRGDGASLQKLRFGSPSAGAGAGVSAGRPQQGQAEIYAVSRLHYGLNEAFRNTLLHSAEEAAANGTAPATTHPCVLRELEVKLDDVDAGTVANGARAAAASPSFAGAGDFDACIIAVRGFVTAAEKSGRGGLGVSPITPPVPKGMDFVALDNLGFVTIGALWGAFDAPTVPRFEQSPFPLMRSMPSPTLLEIARKGRIFCRRPWSEIRATVDVAIRVGLVVCLLLPPFLPPPPITLPVFELNLSCNTYAT